MTLTPFKISHTKKKNKKKYLILCSAPIREYFTDSLDYEAIISKSSSVLIIRAALFHPGVGPGKGKTSALSSQIV